jgi:septal ring factor EnvC (AmiA/AmiB activator)
MLRLFIPFLSINTSYQQRLIASLLIIGLLFPSVLTAQENDNSLSIQQQNRDKLDDVQQAIAEQESNIYDTNKQRSAIEHELKADDLAIANVTKKINNIERDLVVTEAEILTLKSEKDRLTQAKKRQEQLLAQQLRSAYTAGQHDYLKLLLNQDKTEKIQRTLSYYEYLNQARIKEITEFNQTIAQLLEVSTEHQAKIETLDILKNQQILESKSLNANKKQQSKRLNTLSKQILSSQQQLDKLKAEENNLNQALNKLAAIIKTEIDLTGLSKLKNRLSWPVKGKVLHSFGSKKQGYLTWKGVLISAPISRQVNTIHNGTVLFSDWLKGYGLLTVIDHGNGYMSLYAHNQTLLKSIGDRVEIGEPIALVGQSGGQTSSGLYFEIRHQGKALNPKLWCR